MPIFNAGQVAYKDGSGPIGPHGRRRLPDARRLLPRLASPHISWRVSGPKNNCHTTTTDESPYITHLRSSANPRPDSQRNGIVHQHSSTFAIVPQLGQVPSQEGRSLYKLNGLNRTKVKCSATEHEPTDTVRHTRLRVNISRI